MGRYTIYGCIEGRLREKDRGWMVNRRVRKDDEGIGRGLVEEAGWINT